MTTKQPGERITIQTPSSSTTEKVSYSGKEKILEIQYTGGRTYQYFNVPYSVWKKYQQTIQKGGSSGKFVNLYIKPVFVDYREI